jgi:ABC-type nickel/cobalt efflux system permease component RcnA
LVLVLAFALDLVWGGVVAVMMMSVGTAITVSTLAVIAVNARSFAQSLSQGIDRSYLLWIGDGVAICGGVAILFLGISLAMGSISVQSHPLL